MSRLTLDAVNPLHGERECLDAAYCYRRGVVYVWVRSITTRRGVVCVWMQSITTDVAWCVSVCGLLLQTWRGLCGMVCVWVRPIATCVAWSVSGRGLLLRVWRGVCRSALRRVLRLARVLCRRRRCRHRRCHHRRFSPSRPSQQNLRNQPSPNDLSCTFWARVVKAHKLRRSVASSTL